MPTGLKKRWFKKPWPRLFAKSLKNYFGQNKPENADRALLELPGETEADSNEHSNPPQKTTHLFQQRPVLDACNICPRFINAFWIFSYLFFGTGDHSFSLIARHIRFSSGGGAGAAAPGGFEKPQGQQQLRIVPAPHQDARGGSRPEMQSRDYFIVSIRLLFICFCSGPCFAPQPNRSVDHTWSNAPRARCVIGHILRLAQDGWKSVFIIVVFETSQAFLFVFCSCKFDK